jgi:hypothetical protein
MTISGSRWSLTMIPPTPEGNHMKDRDIRLDALRLAVSSSTDKDTHKTIAQRAETFHAFLSDGAELLPPVFLDDEAPP